MADEATKTAAPSGGSASNVSVMGIVLICILAIFMVISLNRMKIELIKLNQEIDTLINTTAQTSMGSFQAVDAEGNLQMRFVPVPVEAMVGEGGEMMEGCSMAPPSP